MTLHASALVLVQSRENLSVLSSAAIYICVCHLQAQQLRDIMARERADAMAEALLEGDSVRERSPRRTEAPPRGALATQLDAASSTDGRPPRHTEASPSATLAVE